MNLHAAMLLRLAVLLGTVAAVAAAGTALRAHWVGIGEARVQATWDKQKKADADLALQLVQRAAADQAITHRNAERTADESHRREQGRARRLAVAQRSAAGLRDAIAKLDADDLSAAAADPRVAAIAERAITARQLLGSCSARHLDVAGQAQRLADQVAGLRAFALNVCRAGGESTSTKGAAGQPAAQNKEPAP